MEKSKFNFISKYASYTTKVEVGEGKYEQIDFAQSVYATNDAKIAEAIRKHPYFGIEMHEEKVVPQAAAEAAPEPPKQKEPEQPKAPETQAEPAKVEEPPKAAAKKTFQCEKCKSKFASQTALEAHIAAMHS